MATKTKIPLHSSTPLRRRHLNRLFAAIYSAAIAALFYRHATTLLRPTFISLSMLAADFILAFMWLNSQAFRMNPVASHPFPDDLQRSFLNPSEDFPALDVFICTADASKEPPLTVAATALSAMAYDYPREKLSVYVSDDGASDLTLFALMEAAEFGKKWVPFCKENRVMERCPQAYFGSEFVEFSSETEKMKEMYENMKRRIDDVVQKGFVPDEYKASVPASKAFAKWGEEDFTPLDHEAVIEVLSQNGEDRDVVGCPMPNLVYVSRQKKRTSPHHFKAGALNVLLRVSALMSNAPIILTLDCDMISNDPSTPLKMLCYFMDTSVKSRLAYVQFPVRPYGVNKYDIYASEFRRIYHIHPVGLNGLSGPDYFGTGTFFNRRAFYGGPSSLIEPTDPRLGPGYVVKKPIHDHAILELAHLVAGCDYEDSKWGSKIGFRYGSLVEDYYTGFMLHGEGWKSVFCNPTRPAFLSEMPISLNDVVTQTKRWAVGLLEITLSKHSTLTFRRRVIGPLMAHAYSYYSFGPFWSIPITIYAFLPQICILVNISVFPKASDPWFYLYAFLFLGAYGQDLVEFMLARGTVQRWWNDQRMWPLRGLTSDLFGTLEYVGNHLGISARGFNVTNKVDDEDVRKRYDEGKFEFGVASPMFVPLSAAAIVNLVACLGGVVQVVRGRDIEELLGQMVVAGFGVVNSWPVYEAMVFRSDGGRMPTKITLISVVLAWIVFSVVSLVAKV